MKNRNQIMAVFLAASTLMTSQPVLAANLNSAATLSTTQTQADENTEASNDKNVATEKDSSTSSKVQATKESGYYIVAPKKVTLDKTDDGNSADYKLILKGDIAGNETLQVLPKTKEIDLSQTGKDNMTATVTQEDETKCTWADIAGDGHTYTGNVKATDLSSGKWTGNAEFVVNYVVEEVAGLYDAQNNMLVAWDDLEYDLESDKDYSKTDYKTDTSSLYSIIKANYPTAVKAVLPTTAITIGANSFYGIDQLTTIIIPENIVTINNSAFSGCSGVENISLPKNLTELGSSALANCSNLKSITIPAGVTSIKDNLLSNCTSLQTVNFEDGVTEIGASAFLGCKTLKTVNIPASVKTIGGSAFSGCSNLTEVNMQDGLETIKANAFGNCSALTEFNMPDTVKTIESAAFMSDSNLTNLHISNTIQSIGGGFISGCSNLTDLTLPGSLGVISSYNLLSGSSIHNLVYGEGITDIASEGAPCYLSVGSTIESVKFPSTLKTIKNGAFSGCTKLSSVEFANGVETIGNSAFSGCTALTNFVMPDSVRDIGSGAFSGSGLKEITLSANLERISSGVFSGVTSLTEIKCSDAEADDTYLLENPDDRVCASGSMPNTLTNVELPDKIRIIQDEVFAGNTKLTTVKLPEQLTKLGKTKTSYDSGRVFSGCSSLQSIDIPDGVTEIPYYTFGGCSSLTNITGCDNVTTIGQAAFNGDSALESINLPKVTSIGTSALSGCNSLVTLDLPELVTFGSSGGVIDAAKLETLNMPKLRSFGTGTSIIGSGCSKLTSITVSPNLEYIGSGAILTNSIEEWNYSDETVDDTYVMDVDDSQRVLNASGNYCFSSDSKLTSFKLPVKITHVGDEVFKSCQSLKNVEFHDNLKTIGQSAFMSCKGLTEVTIPESCTVLKNNAFTGCSNLDITVPSTTLMGDNNNDYVCNGVKNINYEGDWSMFPCWANNCNPYDLETGFLKWQFYSSYSETKDQVVKDSDITYLNRNYKTAKTITSYGGKGQMVGLASTPYIENLIIPNKIGDQVVENVHQYSDGMTQNAKSIVYSEGIKYIDNGNLNGSQCTNVEKLSLPSTIEFVGSGFANNMPKLSTIEYAGKEYTDMFELIKAMNNNGVAVDGILTMDNGLLTKDNLNQKLVSAGIISGNLDEDGSLIYSLIPETKSYSGTADNPVNKRYNSCWGSESDKTVTIVFGDQIDSLCLSSSDRIGNMPNLTTAKISSNIKYIGSGAFASCPKLANIEYNGTTYTDLDSFKAAFTANGGTIDGTICAGSVIAGEAASESTQTVTKSVSNKAVAVQSAKSSSTKKAAKTNVFTALANKIVSFFTK